MRLSLTGHIVYPVGAGTRTTPALFFWISLEYADDVDPVCHQERIPQQAPQHSDRIEHCFFAALADFHDDAVACLRVRRRGRGVGAKTGGAASGIAHFHPAKLLSG